MALLGLFHLTSITNRLIFGRHHLSVTTKLSRLTYNSTEWICSFFDVAISRSLASWATSAPVSRLPSSISHQPMFCIKKQSRISHSFSILSDKLIASFIPEDALSTTTSSFKRSCSVWCHWSNCSLIPPNTGLVSTAVQTNGGKQGPC